MCGDAHSPGSGVRAPHTGLFCSPFTAQIGISRSGRLACSTKTRIYSMTPFTSVLIVDDEPSFRELMTRWVESLGLQAVTAGDADEAVAALNGRSCDLAIIDVVMPGKNGLWLAEALLRDHPETAVVLATGNAATVAGPGAGHRRLPGQAVPPRSLHARARSRTRVAPPRRRRDRMAASPVRRGAGRDCRHPGIHPHGARQGRQRGPRAVSARIRPDPRCHGTQRTRRALRALDCC